MLDEILKIMTEDFQMEGAAADVDDRNIVTLRGICGSWQTLVDVGHRKMCIRDSTSAGTAVDAGISVDYILAISLRDSAYGTFAGAASAANAGISNNVCHDKILLLNGCKHIL